MKQIRTQDSIDEAVLPKISRPIVSIPEVNIQMEEDEHNSKGRDGSVRDKASQYYREDG